MFKGVAGTGEDPWLFLSYLLEVSEHEGWGEGSPMQPPGVSAWPKAASAGLGGAVPVNSVRGVMPARNNFICGCALGGQVILHIYLSVLQ